MAATIISGENQQEEGCFSGVNGCTHSRSAQGRAKNGGASPAEGFRLSPCPVEVLK